MSNIGDNKRSLNLNSLNEEDRKKFKSAILEMNDSMTRVLGERQLQKDIIQKISEDFDIEKKLVRRLAKTYFNANFVEEVTNNNDFEKLYNIVIRGSNE